MVGLVVRSGQAQAPSSIAGTAILQSITSGTYPLASYGYGLLLINNAGTGYQNILVYATVASGGSCTFTKNSATQMTIVAVDSVDGATTLTATFTDANDGTTVSWPNAYPSFQQTTDFVFVNQSAPASIAGKAFTATIDDGAAPFYVSGSYTFTISADGKSYSTDLGESGACSYSLANRSTGKLQINDNLLGAVTIYIGFESASTGGFVATRGTGFQIGTFEFLDTTPPSVAITPPKNNGAVSNTLVSIAGTASDNVGVYQVWYQVGSNTPALATTVNNWTNWAGTVTLTAPGTSTVSAYAIDTSGNASTNASIQLTYILNAKISIATNGLGSVGGVTNGAVLQLGKNYQVTATPAVGFVFTNWTGSFATNKPTLSFTMQSDTSLIANFVETNKPTVKITFPVAGQRMTNAIVNLEGTASDPWGVVGLWYMDSSKVWMTAWTTNRYTNWTATTTLIAGTNTLFVYAQNKGVNIAGTTVNVFSTNAFKLMITAAPNGVVSVQTSGGLNGEILVSTNLSTWQTWTNFAGTNLTRKDPAAGNSAMRFYRATVP